MSYLGLSLGTGAGFVVLAAASLSLLKQAAFRPALLYAWLAGKPWPRTEQDFVKRAPLVHWLLMAVVAMPVLLLLGTAAEAAEVDPLAGVGTLLIGCSLFAVAWALSALVAARYRLVSTARAALVVAVVAVVAYLIAFLFVSDYSFLGTSAVFVGSSVVPTAYLAFRHSSERGIVLAELLHGSSTPVPSVKSARSLGLYALSTALLVANAIVIAARAEDGHALGLPVLAACLVLDLVLLFHVNAHPEASPSGVALATLLGRCATFLPGSERWFVGHCFLVFIIGVRLALDAVDARLKWSPSRVRHQELLRQAAAVRDSLHHAGVAAAVAAAPANTGDQGVDGLRVASAKSALLGPEGLFAGLALIFCAEIIVVSFEPSGLLVPDILGRPQWLYGPTALCAAAGIATGLVAVAKAHLADFERLSWPWVAASYALLCGAGALISHLFTLPIIGLSVAVVPAVAVCAERGYKAWSARDFAVFGPPLLQTTAHEQEPSSSTLRTAWDATNPVLRWWLLGALVLYALGGVAHLAHNDSAWVSWTVVATVNTSAAILLARARYFHRQSLGRFGLGMAAYSVLSLVLWASLVGGSVECGIAATFYAFLWTLGMALHEWADNDGRLDLAVKAGLAAAALLLVAVDLLIALAFSWRECAVAAVLQLSLCSLAAVASHWKRSGGFLSRPYKAVLVLQLAVLVAAGIYVAVVDGQAFVGSSVAWLALTAAAGCVAVNEEALGKTARIFSSRIFPVYILDPTVKRLREDNTGAVATFATLGMLWAWGLGASIFLTDATYVGIFVASMAAVLSCLYVFHRRHEAGVELAKAVGGDPAVVMRAFAEALRELDDELPTAKVGGAGPGAGEDTKSSADIDAKLTACVELADTLQEAFETNVSGFCSGRFSGNVLRSMTAVVMGWENFTSRADLFSLFEQLRLLNEAREATQRFGAAVQLYVGAYGRQARLEAEAKFVAFLREQGITHLQSGSIDLLPADLRDALHDDWVQFQQRCEAEAAEKERLRLAELAKAERRRQDREEQERVEREADRQRLLRERAEEEARIAEQRRQEQEERLLQEEAARERDRFERDAEEAAQLQAEREARRLEELAEQEAADRARREAQELADAIRDADRTADDAPVETVDLEALQATIPADGKFTDTAFPPGQPSLGGSMTNFQWARFSDLVNQPELYVDGADPSDINQGGLGDCWFLSAISCVAAQDKLMERLFVHSDPERGLYVIQFMKDRRWRQVVVDDFFPVRNRRLALAHSSSPQEAWVQVLEKAYAKVHGSYAALDGGLVHFALADLTGGGSEKIDMTAADVKTEIATGALFNRLKEFKELGYLLGAGSPAGSDTVTSNSGIVQGHAYSLLDVRELDGVQLVQLRNPWGRTEWKGAWSDGSGEWNARRRAKLGQEDRDDGAFWMTMQDFAANFEDIYVCRVFDSSWNRSCAFCEWTGPSAGGCSNFETVCNNPQFHLTVSEPTLAYIILAQDDQRGHGSHFAIGFTVLKLNGGGVATRRWGSRSVVRDTDSFVYTREQAMEVRLDPGVVYTVVPQTFNPGEETHFTLTVFAKAEVTLEGPLGASQEPVMASV